jgi:hypothetical protein
MGNVKRNFIKGRMNKSVDERLVPNGEYIDALNVRLGSTEGSEIGSVENSKGNTRLTTLQYQGVDLSDSARCIGAFEDGVNETIYWFIHDSDNSASATGVVDIIASFRTTDEVLTYHVISTSVLNFNPTFLITGVNKVEDLLFFTDDYNPPRKINVVENYPQPIAATDVDQITNDDINVIKKPPTAAPTLTLIDIPGEEDYLESHFVSFSYRYKYVNNDYSALSQFTDVAFESSPFSLDPATNFNTGMLNRYNTAVVGINTGGEDVVGIDLCFKLGTDSTVRVIQKYIKSEEGWPNNVVQTVNFTNQKIYTLLPQSEIARLYDNVPLKAQAQTIMGNRLMYGNYVDGYDLTIASGARIDTNYSAEVVSETLSVFQAAGDVASQSYSIDQNATPSTTGKAVIDFDTAPDLVQGGVFGFSFTVTHASFSGSGTGSADLPNQPTFTISFVYTLPQAYNNVYEMVTSPEFQSQLGANGSGTYQSLASCADGSTFTDVFNCSLIAPSGYTTVNSGITALSQGVFIDVNPTSANEFGVSILGVQYNNTSEGDNQYFEYFNVSNVSYSLQQQSSNKSLHSNRDYEVGVVYMDEYKRATTALTSNQNAVFVPPVNSDDINKIRVTIPTNMTAPSWAETYKFVLKQSKGAYETIYANIYYYDPSTTSYWFRLIGQDQALIEAGTELIVKRDSTGILSSETKAVVLDKVSQPTNFLHLTLESSTVLEVPGLYMRLRAEGFSIDTTVSSYSVAGQITSSVTNDSGQPNSTQTATSNNDESCVNYPCFQNDGTQNNRVAIPSGSLVTIKIKFNRQAQISTCAVPGNAGASLCRVTKTITASQDYSDIQAFWDGEGVGPVIINAMDCSVDCQYTGGPNTNTYYPGSYSVAANTESTIIPFVPNNNQIFFYTISNDSALPVSQQRLYLRCQNGTPGNFLPYNDRPSITEVNITIQEPGSFIVFETEPAEVADDIFYEGSENYAITGGYHQGNVTNQDATTEGVVDLDFFNCYSFGNGVESYKIEDSAVGESFQLGERAVLVAAQDFKEADRFADITYSGIYNDESNVNKLNEFNLGLLNFKPLEDVYGPIQKMVARETDILVLQEDRISYVVVNKNVLTDAQGGSVLTAAPVILGQQVARVEEYGVSANPESYAEFGFDKYFTDAKRGAVIQLRGTSASNETLTVISKAGMRSWFRDLFNESFTTQKLGGFDPYMDEYVLASNDILLPVESKCINCGIPQTISLLRDRSTNSFCVNVGSAVGDIEVVWGQPTLIGLGTSFNVVATFDTTYSALNQTGPGSLTIPKTSVLPNTVSVVITANGGAVNNLPITVECPDATEINVIMVSLNLDWQNTKTIHSQFRFVDGTTLSPTYSDFVEFGAGENPVVSQYQVLTGDQGSSVFPPQGATVYVQSAKLAGDVFDFLPAENNLKHWRTTQLYSNTPANIQTILSNSTDLALTPATDGASLYSGNFNFNGSGNYLYLVYDYRQALAADLCFGLKDVEACCCTVTSSYYLDAENLSVATTVYTDINLTNPAIDGFYQAIVNGNSIWREQTAGVLGPVENCTSCIEDCNQPSLPPSTITLTPDSLYEINYDLDVGTGVCVIRFTPDIPAGIYVTYNNVITSDSSNTILLDTNENPITSWFPGPYYGDTSTAGTPVTGVNSLTRYVWDYVDQDFELDGTTSATIVAGDLTSLNNGNAGTSVLYVSKPSLFPTNLNVRIVSPLATVPDWGITVECPVRLSGFSVSNFQSTSSGICSEPFSFNLYNIPVRTTSSPGIPNVADWVFIDELGETRASEGYYRVSGYYIRVGSNGVIVEKTFCP